MNIEIKNQLESEPESAIAKMMSEEYAEAVAMLEKANSAFQRLFGGESE